MESELARHVPQLGRHTRTQRLRPHWSHRNNVLDGPRPKRVLPALHIGHPISSPVAAGSSFKRNRRRVCIGTCPDSVRYFALKQFPLNDRNSMTSHLTGLFPAEKLRPDPYEWDGRLSLGRDVRCLLSSGRSSKQDSSATLRRVTIALLACANRCGTRSRPAANVCDRSWCCWPAKRAAATRQMQSPQRSPSNSSTRIR